MLADTLAAYTNQQPQGLSIFWFDPRGAAKTWIFRTRTGRAGALEILEDGRESGPMKIRYKLVEPLTTAYLGAMVRDAPPPMTAPATHVTRRESGFMVKSSPKQSATTIISFPKAACLLKCK
jgi:hypothetical protein